MLTDFPSVSEVYETDSSEVANKLMEHKWILLDCYHTGGLNVTEIFVLGKPVSFESIDYSPEQAQKDCSCYRDLTTYTP